MVSGLFNGKIVTSFLVHSIPIYWGNPLIEEEYNPKVFINYHRYSSLDEVADQIKRIDEDDDLWRSMVAEPKRLPWQIERAQEKEDKLTAVLINIFTSPAHQARKRGDCLWLNNYRNFFINNLSSREKTPRGRLEIRLKKLFRRS